MRVLTLSGGGFRAALFHLGVVRQLAEKGELDNIDLICSVSGGSILAAHLVLNWEIYKNIDTFSIAASSIVSFAQSGMREAIFQKWFFARFGILVFAIGIGCWAFAIPNCFWWIIISALALFVAGLAMGLCIHRWSRASLLAEAYDRGLYSKDPNAESKTSKRKRLLRDLNPNPELRPRPKLFILNTNLNTGNLCAFSDDGFYAWGDEEHPLQFGSGDITIAEAVAASSAFPPAFAPFRLSRERLGQEATTLDPLLLLTDGGVFDNSGIQAFLKWARFKGSIDVSNTGVGKVIVCNAERMFDKMDTKLSWFRLLPYRSLRANDIIMHRVSVYQMQDAEEVSCPIKDIQLAGMIRGSNLSDDVQLRIRNIRTDFNRFTAAEIQLLVYYGYWRAHEKWCAESLAIAMESRQDREGSDTATSRAVVVLKESPTSERQNIGLQKGDRIAMVNDKRITKIEDVHSELSDVSRSNEIVINVVTGQGGSQQVRFPFAVAGIEMTQARLPFVRQRAGTENWLPFGENKMQTTYPKLGKSDRVPLFTAFVQAAGACLLIFLLMSGSAWIYNSYFSRPTSISFDKVFGETAATGFEKGILEEINRDEVLLLYKRSLLPSEPLPKRVIFFGVTKELGEYTGGRTPAPFKCKIVAHESYHMKVRLFIREERRDSVAYQIVPAGDSFQFKVPEASVKARLVAIGRIEEPEDRPFGDLKDIVHLEVEK